MMLPGKTLALVALLGVLACGKDKTSPPAGKEEALARALDVATLPAETQVIIGASVPRVLESVVLRRLIDQALARDPDARARLESLLGRCKIALDRDAREAQQERDDRQPRTPESRQNQRERQNQQ